MKGRAERDRWAIRDGKKGEMDKYKVMESKRTERDRDIEGVDVILCSHCVPKPFQGHTAPSSV